MTILEEVTKHILPELASIVMNYWHTDWNKKFALVLVSLKMWECDECSGPADEDRDGCWEEDGAPNQFICIRCYDSLASYRNTNINAVFIENSYFMWRRDKLNDLRDTRNMANIVKRKEREEMMASMIEMIEKAKAAQLRQLRYEQLRCACDAISTT